MEISVFPSLFLLYLVLLAAFGSVVHSIFQEHFLLLSSAAVCSILFYFILFYFILFYFLSYQHHQLLHLILIMQFFSDNLKALKHRVLTSQILGSSGILPSDARFLRDQKKIEIFLYFVLHEVLKQKKRL